MGRYINSEGNPQLTDVSVPTDEPTWGTEYAEYLLKYKRAEDSEKWALADYIGDVLADFEMYKPEP